jgi:hypothetical protein
MPWLRRDVDVLRREGDRRQHSGIPGRGRGHVQGRPRVAHQRGL